MGFFLTIFYLAVAYLSTGTVFGPLAAQVHTELILAALAFLASIPALTKTFILKTPQLYALFGLAFAVGWSVLMTGWAGGAEQAFLSFIPFAFAYFLVCVQCTTKNRQRILVLMQLLVCLFVIVRGSMDLYGGVAEIHPDQPGETRSAYLLAQRSDAGEWFYRLRGQNFINDPNDFAQLIVCELPLVFIFWRPKKLLRNIVFVILPVCALLFGVFLTHSRGALLALLAIAVVAGRRYIGMVASLILATGMFFAMSVTNFTGGRSISLESGSGRMGLWGGGLEVLRSHPLFGVGYGNLPDYIGMTAHNSIVVCVAELGLIGLYFWSLFLFPTLRNALALASRSKVREGEPALAEETVYPQLTGRTEEIDKAEVNRLGYLIVLSFTGFLVTGWFLSRAYAVMLFLQGGMVEVVYEMALRRGMIAPRLKFGRVLMYAGVMAISMLLVVYVILRITNLMR